MTVRVETLSRGLIMHSFRLLDMEYKPSEIAEELDTSKRKLLNLFLPARLPGKMQKATSGYMAKPSRAGLQMLRQRSLKIRTSLQITKLTALAAGKL